MIPSNPQKTGKTGKTLMVRVEPNLSGTLSPGDPRNQTAAVTAVTSIAVWALTRYVSAPPEISAAVAVVVPAALAWVGAHLAYRATPPRTETPILAKPESRTGTEGSIRITVGDPPGPAGMAGTGGAP